LRYCRDHWHEGKNIIEKIYPKIFIRKYYPRNIILQGSYTSTPLCTTFSHVVLNIVHPLLHKTSRRHMEDSIDYIDCNSESGSFAVWFIRRRESMVNSTNLIMTCSVLLLIFSSSNSISCITLNTFAFSI
jgi:hypothetical protein